MKTKIQRLTDYLSPGEYYHLHREEIKRSDKPLHTHDYSEIFIVAEGRGVHEINDQVYKLEKGMICLIRKEDQHRLRSGSGMRVINIAFPETSHHQLDRFGADPDREDRILMISPFDQRQRLDEMIDELAMATPDQLNLECFLLELIKLARTRRGHRFSTHPPWYFRFIRRLDNPEFLALNISEMAEQVGISREHLSREVKRITGTNAVTLVNRKRVEHGVRQLKMTDRRISDIALECGFSSPGRFYQIFREVTGMPPGKLRRLRP